MLWWWGLFASATVTQAFAAPHRYAYLEARGPYSKLASTQRAVRAELDKQGFAIGHEFTLILDDPRTTPYKARTARTGFLIADEAKPRSPLLVDTIPERKVLVAEVRAHPLFAYGKGYAALLDYTARHGMALRLPTVEIYHDSVLTIEMPLEG